MVAGLQSQTEWFDQLENWRNFAQSSGLVAAVVRSAFAGRGGGEARRYGDCTALECVVGIGVPVMPTATETRSGFVAAVGNVELPENNRF